MIDSDGNDIWWIGGVTCSGKSTVAKLIAEGTDRQVYSTDDHFAKHAKSATKEHHPTMYSYQHDDEWLKWVRELAPERSSAVWLQFYHERCSMIVDDLAKVQDPPLVAEGVDLLPELVVPHATEGKAAWLVPTRSFFEAHYAEREWVSEEPDERTWQYYSRMIRHVDDGVRRHGGTVLQVDGDVSPQEIAGSLMAKFQDSAPDR